MKKIRAAIYTLGCKVNSYESNAISQKLRENDIEICSQNEKADICIINTCAVTSEAERKSRQIVRRMISSNSGAYVIVTGCSAQADAERILSLEGVSAVCGNREKMKAAELAIAHADYLRGLTEKSISNVICACELENAPFEPMSIRSSERTRAVLKIEDGCESKCAYCIIPSLRGSIRSKAPSDVIREATDLSLGGYKEIVLTGIEVSAYGKDLSRRDGLISLIEELGRIDSIKRIRLGSLDPSAINGDFINRASLVPSFAPHFHLSLQSGCDRTLFSMKRRYNTKTVKEKIDLIREKIAGATFTSDIIVGFPGETDEDFAQTKEFLNSLDLLSFHIFSYSKRPGTLAAEMPDQIPENVKASREKELEKLRCEMTDRVLDKYIGKELDVMIEEYKKDLGAFGHSMEFIEVAIPNAPDDLHGEICRVICERYENGTVFAKIP